MEPPTAAYSGQIYKLLCDDGHYYIGSTKTDLKYRLYHHKQHSLVWPDRKVYSHILSCGWENVKIICIENVTCASREHLVKKENEYIKQSLSDSLCLNINRAHLTKEELLQQHKEYLEANKLKVDEYQAAYRKENAEKRCEYSKQYAAAQPEVLKAKRHEHYEANKTEIIAKRKAYAQAHVEQVRERKRAWVEKNKDRIVAARVKYMETNKEAIQERGKAYYEANKDVIQENFKVYREKNKEAMKEYAKAYRARNQDTVMCQS